MKILHFKDLGGYRKCRHECSCASAMSVSNFNSKVPQGGFYPDYIAMCLELTMLCHFKVIMDGYTYKNC